MFIKSFVSKKDQSGNCHIYDDSTESWKVYSLSTYTMPIDFLYYFYNSYLTKIVEKYNEKFNYNLDVSALKTDISRSAEIKSDNDITYYICTGMLIDVPYDTEQLTEEEVQAIIDEKNSN